MPAAARIHFERVPGHLEPADLARAALFLAADDSRMRIGQNYLVDGGRA